MKHVKVQNGIGRVEQAQMMEAKKRELFFVGRLSDYFNAVRELYERVCGKSYPDHNYAADDFLLLKLVGDRAELLRTKLDEWVQPCFCRGKAKCLMCETRTLLQKTKPTQKCNQKTKPNTHDFK